MRNPRAWAWPTRMARATALIAFVSMVTSGPPSRADQCTAPQIHTTDDSFVFPSFDPVMADVLANDRHSHGLPMSVVIDGVQTPEGLGALEVNPDSTVTYHRPAGFQGVFRFTYRTTVDDGGSQTSAPVSASLNLWEFDNLPAHHRPDSRDDTIVVPEGSTAHHITAAQLLANDTDLDPGQTDLLIVDPSTLGSPLRGNLVVDLVDPASGGLVQLSYLPGSDFFLEGWDQFTYQAVDPDGLSGLATVHLFLEGWTGPPNAPPTAADHLFEIPQSTRTFLSWASLLDGSSDPDGDWLTVQLLSEPDPAVTRQWIVEDGGVVWQPETSFLGAASFEYQVFDGEDASAPATVTLDVKTIIDPPTAGFDGPFVVPKHGRLFLHLEDDPSTPEIEPNLFGNDRSYIPDSDLVPIVLAFGQPSHGRLDFCCDGRGFWYIPDDGYSGTDSFWYTVGDANFRHATAKVRLDVQHLGGPDPPPTRAVSGSLLASSLDETAFLWSDLMAWAEGTNLRLRTLFPEGLDPIPLPHGQIEILSPGYDYGGSELPPAEHEGAVVYHNTSVPPANDWDSVDYEIVRADDLSSDIGTSELRAPDPAGNYNAYNDLIRTVEGRTSNAWYNLLLDNDQLSALPGTDPYIDPVFLSRPRVGAFTHLTGHGGVAYRPPPGFVGVDSFTYRVVDRNHIAPDVVARVVVVVEPGAPIPQYDLAQTFQGQAIEIDVLANDGDRNGDPLHLVAVTRPPTGQTILVGSGADGRVLYTPEADFIGVETFGYTVADPDGNEASNAVEVTVIPNDPPVAVARSFCDGLHCRFDATESSDDLGIASYSWALDPGGPQTGSDSEPEILLDLPAAGEYTLTLTVTDLGSRSAQVSTAFSADPEQPGDPPIAHFTYECSAHATCTFDASTSADDVEITEYQWDFGDQIRRIGKVQTYTFLTPDGQHAVTLAVRDASNQVSTYTTTLTPSSPQ